MPDTDVGENGYRVVYSEVGRTTMNAAIKELLAAGWSKTDAEHLVSDVENRVRSDPHAFGEPHFSIKSVNLKGAVGFARPLSVEIGIHEETRIVFVRRVTLMTTDRD